MKILRQFAINSIVVIALLLSSATSAGELSSIEELLKNADDLRSSNPIKFLTLIDSIKKQPIDLTKEQEARLIYFEGYASAYSGNYQSAIDKYSLALQNTNDKKLKLRLTLSMVNTYAIMRNWTQGLAILENALIIADEVEGSDAKVESALVAALFYNQLGQYRIALDFVNVLFSHNATGRNKCFGYWLDLEAKVRLKEIQSDDPKFDEGAKYCLNISEQVLASFIYLHQIQALITEKKYSAADELMEKHFNSIINTKYQRLISEVYSLRAEVLFQLGQLRAANNSAIKAIALSKGAKFSQPILQALKIQTEVAISKNNFKNAVKLQQKYAVAEKGYLDEKTAKQLAYHRARMELLDKNNQISLLNNNNEILQLEQNLAKEEAATSRWVIGFLLLWVFALAAWLFYIKKLHLRLRYLAEFDSLTNIRNRANFTDIVNSILNKSSHSKSTSCFIMFDLDDFKNINDSYGHLVGDQVLIEVAKKCSQQIRQADIFGRIGGEEFAILLPACEIEDALKVAEKCRKSLTNIDCKRLFGHDFIVSASFGITETKSSGYKLQNIQNHADKAMYLAKEKGRNRLIYWKTKLVPEF